MNASAIDSECPNCGAERWDDQTVCDCGYVYVGYTEPEVHDELVGDKKDRTQTWVLGGAMIVLGAGVALVGHFSLESQLLTIVGGFLKLVGWIFIGLRGR